VYTSQPIEQYIEQAETIEEDLRHCPVQDITYLKKSNHMIYRFPPVYFVTLKNGLKAVFKSRTEWENLAEMVAYRISKHLGINCVPPTVLKKINNQWGSLQLYIPHSRRNQSYKNLSTTSIKTLHVYGYILGNVDVSIKHNVISRGIKGFMIDNAYIKDISLGHEDGSIQCLHKRKMQSFNIKNIPKNILAPYKQLSYSFLNMSSNEEILYIT
jgi:hypothetical protein